MQELYDIFEQHHIYDSSLCFNNQNNQSMIDCLINNKPVSNDNEIIWKMKYDKKYDKKLVFQIIMRKTCNCALLIFSRLCHKDDKDLYRNEFFNIPSIKNNTNIYNYLYAKVIIHDELNNKTKSKEEFFKALILINLVDNNLYKSVAYYKYVANYFCGNYDMALENLIIFLKSLKYYNPEYCEIFFDKFNMIKLYIGINKLENKDIFIQLFEKIYNDNKIKFIHNKINNSKNTICINCKKKSIAINFYNCNHFHCLECLECITEKYCFFCKNRLIS